MLGCTESCDVHITERGGGGAKVVVPHTSVEWHRSLDVTSTATVRVDGADGEAGSECCADLSEIDAWSHEVAIYRNHLRVWCGPITAIHYGTGIQIDALDLSAWLDHRRIHTRHDDEDRDACEVAADYIADALSVDESPNMAVRVDYPAEAITRLVKKLENKMCLPEIGELARTLIDWTVVERTFILSGAEIEVPPFVTLVDSHFADLADLDRDGTRVVTTQVMTGQGSGVEGAAVQAEVSASNEILARYGVLESVASEDGITREAQARRGAQTRIDLLAEPATTFTGGKLDESFPLDAADLIPGMRMAVRLTDRCRPVLGEYRLVGVSASVGPDSDEMSIDVEPVGTIE